uniref:Retrovirus-related Pol polyprotein from transposon TNT 1-94 n=1 Tax=Tanacetum cinerariifolium TaxID=118510 RepID=A0A699INK0_TANCI|nr:retrovirus-related Pol polyprotein from transposon TNT 1-94 [Tanacetum cinerariifolium]
MTGNKSFLTDYQEIDGGFVAFGGIPKGGKISGKGNIRTEKLDFEDNRVLVIKPHNKTPYELLIGRSPNLDFMRPFGCPVTILNTLDHLGKFEGKVDEGFLVGYSKNSKAFREKASDHEYILLPFMPSLTTQISDDKDADEIPGKGDEGVSNGSRVDDQERTDIKTNIFDDVYNDIEVGAEADTNNLELLTVVSPIPTTRVHKDHPKEQIIGDLNLATQTRRMINFSKENNVVIRSLTYPSWIEAMQEELLQFKLQKVWTRVDLPNSKRAIRTKWVIRNKKDERGIVIRNKERLVAQGYTQEEVIDYDEVFAPVARIEAIRLFLAYPSFLGFLVYQMDVKSAFMYDTIEKEVYVCQHPGFEDLHFPNKVCKIEKVLYGLHQAPRACQDKYVADILKKFDFTTVKTASTPIEPNKTLIKDAEAEDVYVHLYRSKIRSLLYLTASSPDIMFAKCEKQTIVANSTTKAEYVAAASCYGQVKQSSMDVLDEMITTVL